MESPPNDQSATGVLAGKSQERVDFRGSCRKAVRRPRTFTQCPGKNPRRRGTRLALHTRNPEGGANDAETCGVHVRGLSAGPRAGADVGPEATRREKGCNGTDQTDTRSGNVHQLLCAVSRADGKGRRSGG